MRNTLIIVLILLFCISVKAQTYPSEWLKYTTDSYLFDIESDNSTQHIDEAKFKNNLLDLARANLSKQIQVRVMEESKLNKTDIDGISHTIYESSSLSTTKLDLKFVKTENFIDNVTGTVFAIAYINKERVRQYYENEFQMLLSKTDNAFQIAEKYVQQGLKNKAKCELQGVLSELDSIGGKFFWFNVFGMPEQQLQQLVRQTQQAEQNLKIKIAELEHSTTYCTICTVDNFGKPYSKLENEVKGKLSASGCNFTDNPAYADYIIRIKATTRKYKKAHVGKSEAYFVYVDVAMSIENSITGHRIYEGESSVKGSHTSGFDEAACEAYKNTSNYLAKLIQENIEL